MPVRTRRYFLGAGASIATAAAMNCHTGWASGDASEHPDAVNVTGAYYRVIYDQRFAAAVAFAAEARRFGAEPSGIRGDVTALWYDDLYHRWSKGPAAIAGMSTHYSMFVLEMMARDAGMRLVYEAIHRPTLIGQPLQPGLAAMHRRYGPAMFLGNQPELNTPDWVATDARSIMQWHVGMPAALPTSILHARRESIGPDALVSWIIAPGAPGDQPRSRI